MILLFDAGEGEPGHEQALHFSSSHPLAMEHLTPSSYPSPIAPQNSCKLHLRALISISCPGHTFLQVHLESPQCNVPVSIMSTHFCSGWFYLFLQGQPGLGGGLSNSIGLQICLESILILFKGQSIGASLEGSEQEFHIALNMR